MLYPEAKISDEAIQLVIENPVLLLRYVLRKFVDVLSNNRERAVRVEVLRRKCNHALVRGSIGEPGAGLTTVASTPSAVRAYRIRSRPRRSRRGVP